MLKKHNNSDHSESCPGTLDQCIYELSEVIDRWPGAYWVNDDGELCSEDHGHEFLVRSWFEYIGMVKSMRKRSGEMWSELVDLREQKKNAWAADESAPAPGTVKAKTIHIGVGSGQGSRVKETIPFKADSLRLSVVHDNKGAKKNKYSLHANPGDVVVWRGTARECQGRMSHILSRIDHGHSWA
jgi:hypothetical protein